MDILVYCLLFIIFAVIMMLTIEQWRQTQPNNYCYLEPFENSPPKTTVAIVALMRKPIDLPLWFRHHRKMGVKRFYIRLEDSPGWDDYLASQKDVYYEIHQSDKSGNNYETLQDRQIEFVNKCLLIARKDSVQWVFHIDSDELLHGNLSILDELDDKYKCIRIENAEAIFNEDTESCFDASKFIKCNRVNAPCKSYANGKGAGRVEDGVVLAGPHHFAYNNKIQGNHIYETPFEKLHVLHFDSCSLGSWLEKFYHLSKQKKANIPFEYYNESIDAAKIAYKVYKKNKIDNGKGVDNDTMFILDDGNVIS
jgi:hypothetical protein